MEWTLTKREQTCLRELARKQAEYASLPVMADRRRMWYDLNDGARNARPPFVVETNSWDRDFMPESVYRCASPTARGIERQLLRNVRNHELLDDDKVIPATFDVGWFVDIDDCERLIRRRKVEDAQGVPTGYETIHPIKDIERDLDLLKPAVCRVDRERTNAWIAFVEDLLGDLLPVTLRTGPFGRRMLTHRVVDLMGMEAFFTAMYDAPEAVRRLMAFLRDDCLRVSRWAEAEGLLRVNNGNQASFGSSYNFTTRLPVSGGNGEAARLRDMWGCANSQETVGVAPGMFHEFCAPYYHAVCEPLGLVYSFALFG